MDATKQKAELTCPKCGHATELDVPDNKCLAFYKCEGCDQMIGQPKDSEHCCVVCEYSDTKCACCEE